MALDKKAVSMKIAIATFAKTIGLSSVKTRLAADIGKANAEAFYLLSVACIQEAIENIVTQNTNVYPHWVLAEKDAPTRSEWHSFPAMWTGEGGLGTRFASVSQRLLKEHDAVFLIGTDSPQLSAKRFFEVMQIFQVNPKLEHVAGPATDGGFWLWGSTQQLPTDVWEGVTYSEETTLQELVKATNAYGHHVAISHRMQDVDLLEDLVTLQKTFEQKESLILPAQKNLLKWLQANNPTFQE